MKFIADYRDLVESVVAPARIRRVDDGLFVDFGRAAFGTLQLPPGNRVVHLGEKLDHDGRIDRDPPGSVRYLRIESAGGRVVIPPDERNTGSAAIKMPGRIGEVFPFRYAEIEPASDLDAGAVRQIAVHYPFNDDAAAFGSSDETLDAVWELCKYSIKATSFCGVYVDGDRERIPYEADAYINQLGHYGVDREYAMARHTLAYLIEHPTWPTEWQMHAVMMAWADYLYTGQTDLLERFYDDLCIKTLIDLAREDGLISTASERCDRELEERLHLHHPNYIFDHGLRDLVDWPPGSFNESGQGERDGHDMRPINTVVNAFHYHALILMARIADRLGRPGDRDRFSRQAARAGAAFNDVLFCRERGIYIDGEGSNHASLHSNMFALAFGLVPADRRTAVIDFVKSRGMACSVYGAQYLLEALYRHGESRYALELLTARHDRSWWNMIACGSTITLEAWDWKYKNNLDWNHAWGAAPANIIPRYLMGVRPLAPGCGQILIQPQPGNLETARARIPLPQGSVEQSFTNHPAKSFELTVHLPENTTAHVLLPFGELHEYIPPGLHHFRSSV